jgi:hypothetical protein
VLAPIERPSIGPSGQLVDTAAEDPASPPNRLAAADGAEVSTDVAELVKPAEAQPAADMVFAPVRIDDQGRARRAEPAAAPTSPAATGEGAAADPGEMVMAPMLIGKSGAGAVSSQAVMAPPDPVAGEPSAAVVRSSLWHGLRVVRFSAGGDDTGPAYDGLIIERVRD